MVAVNQKMCHTAFYRAPFNFDDGFNNDFHKNGFGAFGGGPRVKDHEEVKYTKDGKVVTRTHEESYDSDRDGKQFGFGGVGGFHRGFGGVGTGIGNVHRGFGVGNSFGAFGKPNIGGFGVGSRFGGSSFGSRGRFGGDPFGPFDK